MGLLITNQRNASAVTHDLNSRYQLPRFFLVFLAMPPNYFFRVHFLPAFLPPSRHQFDSLCPGVVWRGVVCVAALLAAVCVW